MNLTAFMQKLADGYKPIRIQERLMTPMLRGASFIYGAGVAIRTWAFDAGWKRSFNAGCPVISIGNLSVGGTGKTPMVEYVARLLLLHKRKPAIITRGYRRVNSTRSVIVSDGQSIQAKIEESGDEAMMMARRLPGVIIVAGTNRHEAAQIAMHQCGADLMILDDGFQHRALRRDCDIVLWDALRPFQSQALLPRGLLREHISALSRAHALVITRSNLAPSMRKTISRIKRKAPHLNLFQASTEPASLRFWKHPGNPMHVKSLNGLKVGAFCGLGNPRSFWNLLDSCGIRLLQKHAFPDHYRPEIAELNQIVAQSIQKGAEQLITTEKDAENIPSEWTSPLPVLVLSIQMSMGQDQQRFESFILQQAGVT